MESRSGRRLVDEGNNSQKKKKKRMPVCSGDTAFDIATSPRNGFLEDVLEPLILAHL